MTSLFHLQVHGFDLVTFIQHLFFDALASLGVYKARSMCEHAWHRIAVTIVITLLATLALVTLVG